MPWRPLRNKDLIIRIEVHSIVPLGLGHSIVPLGLGHSIVPLGLGHSIVPLGLGHSIVPLGLGHSIVPLGLGHGEPCPYKFFNPDLVGTWPCRVPNPTKRSQILQILAEKQP